MNPLPQIDLACFFASVSALRREYQPEHWSGDNRITQIFSHPLCERAFGPRVASQFRDACWRRCKTLRALIFLHPASHSSRLASNTPSTVAAAHQRLFPLEDTSLPPESSYSSHLLFQSHVWTNKRFPPTSSSAQMQQNRRREENRHQHKSNKLTRADKDTFTRVVIGVCQC